MHTAAWSLPSWNRLPTMGHPGTSASPGIRGCSDLKSSWTRMPQATRTAEATMTNDMDAGDTQERWDGENSGLLLMMMMLLLEVGPGMSSYICLCGGFHPEAGPKIRGTENCASLGRSPSSKSAAADWRGYPCQLAARIPSGTLGSWRQAGLEFKKPPHRSCYYYPKQKKYVWTTAD